MLGRFVVPVARLDEFEASVEAPQHWTLSVLSTGNLEADISRIGCSRARIDTLELKAADAQQIDTAMRKMPHGLTPYFEITDLSLIPVIGANGGRAKIRSGGITPEAFPEASFIAGFLKACAAARTPPFKATAGLHHPLRCHRPLTYSADGPSGWMFGFLNVFPRGFALARNQVEIKTLEQLLMEESPACVHLHGRSRSSGAGRRA